jgi:hypothetical protein
MYTLFGCIIHKEEEKKRDQTLLNVDTQSTTCLDHLR